MMIGRLYHDIIRVDGLKADKPWREEGERSASLLKHLSSSLTMQRTISSLRDPSENHIIIGTAYKTSAMDDFSDQLYISELVDLASLHCRPWPNHLGDYKEYLL
ncbi:hypothetical protein A0J61_04420 [Choanephora cucurbitarum]|uniref:Uncharacterized protein n=1 Tax=Choanephora cucurbitarum TaxID=101091 RepID=A0A1C7NJR3_9FUNG|nr:hypothetical protein A0J61_04420 [Choanephora cucurbitarum]